MKQNLVLLCVLLVLIRQIDSESGAVTESADKLYEDQDGLIKRLQGFIEIVIGKVHQLNNTVMDTHVNLNEKINVQATNTSKKITDLLESRNISQANDFLTDSKEGIKNATKLVEEEISGCLNNISTTMTVAIQEAKEFHENPLFLAIAIGIPEDKPWNDSVVKFENENGQLAEERLQIMKSGYTKCISATMVAFEISLAKVVESIEKCMAKL